MLLRDFITDRPPALAIAMRDARDKLFEELKGEQPLENTLFKAGCGMMGGGCSLLFMGLVVIPIIGIIVLGVFTGVHEQFSKHQEPKQIPSVPHEQTSPAKDDFKYVLRGSYVRVGEVGIIYLTSLLKAMQECTISDIDARRCLIYPCAFPECKLQAELPHHLMFSAMNDEETTFHLAVERDSVLESNHTRWIQDNGEGREAQSIAVYFMDKPMAFSGWGTFPTTGGDASRIAIFRLVRGLSQDE